MNSYNQFTNLKDWKKITEKFIRQSIVDIIKNRINKNACEASINSENEYEDLGIDFNKEIFNDSKNKNFTKSNLVTDNKNLKSINSNKNKENLKDEYEDLQANNLFKKNSYENFSNIIIKNNVDNQSSITIKNKISEGFLYLNFSEIDNFQSENLEYIINISILFRRKDLKFVIENWNFEINLKDEILEIIKNRNFLNNQNYLPKKSYLYKKLNTMSRTIESLLNLLPSIKFFKSNTFDFYLDYDLNYKQIIRENKSGNYVNKNLINQKNKNENQESAKINEKFLESLEYFRTNNTKNSQNNKVSVTDQIEVIKKIMEPKKVFNKYKNSYTDKFGSIKINVEFMNKQDVFNLEDEIKSQLVKIEKKRKRFLSENIDYIPENPNINKNNNFNPNEFIYKAPDNTKNSDKPFYVNDNNLVLAIKENDINQNIDKENLIINSNSVINMDNENILQKKLSSNILEIKNNLNNKSLRIFNNIINENIPNSNMRFNTPSDVTDINIKNCRINSKSEEKIGNIKNSANFPEIGEKKDIDNLKTKAYVDSLRKKSFETDPYDVNISTKCASQTSSLGTSLDRNISKEYGLKIIEDWRKKINFIHNKWNEKESGNADDSDDESSVEIDYEEEIVENKKIGINELIIKTKQLKQILFKDYFQLDSQNFIQFKYETYSLFKN